MAVNNSPVRFYDEFQAVVQQNREKSVNLSLLRAGDTVSLATNVSTEGKLGVLIPPVGLPREPAVAAGLRRARADRARHRHDPLHARTAGRGAGAVRLVADQLPGHLRRRMMRTTGLVRQ